MCDVLCGFTSCTWNRIIAVHLFIQHVCPPGTKEQLSVNKLMPLWTVSDIVNWLLHWLTSSLYSVMSECGTVIGPRSRSQQRKSGSVQLKNYLLETAGLDRNICYDNAWSNSELLTFWPWPLIFNLETFSYFRRFASLGHSLIVTFSLWEVNWYDLEMCLLQYIIWSVESKSSNSKKNMIFQC